LEKILFHIFVDKDVNKGYDTFKNYVKILSLPLLTYRKSV